MAELELGKTASANLKQWVACFQPYSRQTAAGAALRKQGFALARQSSKSSSSVGLCSLAGIESFALQTLQAHGGGGRGGVNDVDAAVARLWAAFQPSVAAAFADAADYKKDGHRDAVSKGEFRLLCAYLCVYGAMADAFATLVDGGRDSSSSSSSSSSISSSSSVSAFDRQLTKAEWMAGYAAVKMHGFWELDCANDLAADALFLKIIPSGENMGFQAFCAHLKESEILAESPVGECLALDEAIDGAGMESDDDDDNATPPPKPTYAPTPKAPPNVAAAAAAVADTVPELRLSDRAELARKPSINVAWDPTATARPSSPRSPPLTPRSPAAAAASTAATATAASLGGSAGAPSFRLSSSPSSPSSPSGNSGTSGPLGSTASRDRRAAGGVTAGLVAVRPLFATSSLVGASSSLGGPSTGDARRDRELEDAAVRRDVLKARTQVSRR
jgi:hypothetical protein